MIYNKNHGCIIRFLQLLTILSTTFELISLSSAQDAGVCASSTCNDTVAMILSNMNSKAHPCQNFYEYMCGEYGKGRDIPEHGEGISIMSDLGDNIPKYIQSYLENNRDDEQNKPYWQAFKIYDQCTDQDTLREQDVKAVKENIDPLGGWPLVEGSSWQKAEWETVSEKLAEQGFDAGIFFDVDMTRQGKGKQAKVGVELRPKIDNKISSETWDKLMNVAKRLGAEDVPAFSTMDPFNNIDSHHVSEKNFDRMTVKQLSSKYPNVDWMTFLTGVFSSTPDVTISESTMVAIIDRYTGEVAQLKRKTSKEHIMNYVIAKAVESALPYLSPEVTTDPNSGLSENQSDEERQKYCADLTTKELPSIVEAMFAVTRVDDNLYKTIMDLGDTLRNEMISMIKSAGYLDEGTIKKDEKKLKDLRFSIGYEDALKDGFYTKDYEDLKLDNDDLLCNVLSIHKVQTNLKYKASSEPAPAKKDDKIKVPMTAMNCQYHPSTNTVNIMPGILQDILIGKDLPDWGLFSGIGFIMGHEVGHGYDMLGKVFGHPKNKNPKRNAAEKKYKEGTECIAKHYHDYLLEHNDVKVDGHQTEKENIADALGVKVAHMAWQKLMKKEGPEPTLAGLDFDLQQTYWVSFAKTKCGRYRPDKFNAMVKTAIHGIHEYRTNGPTADYYAFGEAFSCPLGSPMNPHKKCVIF